MDDASIKAQKDRDAKLDALEEKLVDAYDAVAQEIGALRSIYSGDNGEVVQIYDALDDDVHEGFLARYEVHLNLQEPHTSPETGYRVLVLLTHGYPSAAPPQIRLLSKYIGSFGVDITLNKAIAQTFVSGMGGVEWIGDVCVFDGLENIRERVSSWYSDKLSEAAAKEILRQDEEKVSESPERSSPPEKAESSSNTNTNLTKTEGLPDGIELAVSEPIIDRKSVFIGRACRITNLDQVPAVLTHLLSDRRIAKAAHPIINAWRCRKGTILHQDNDDDGETAAGGRLAHLLQILDVEDVLVIVTRYFGGIHLGPDRFKHINQAARNALEAGGFLSIVDSASNAKSKKR